MSATVEDADPKSTVKEAASKGAVKAGIVSMPTARLQQPAPESPDGPGVKRCRPRGARRSPGPPTMERGRGRRAPMIVAASPTTSRRSVVVAGASIILRPDRTPLEHRPMVSGHGQTCIVQR